MIFGKRRRTPPTGDEIRQWADQVAPLDGTPETFGVIHPGCAIWELKAWREDGRLEVEFVRNVPHFTSPRDFATDRANAVMEVLEGLPEVFEVDDVVDALLPGVRKIDEARRSPEDPWVFTEDPAHPRWDEWEWSDYRELAGQTAFGWLSQAAEEGWATKLDYNQWTLVK